MPDDPRHADGRKARTRKRLVRAATDAFLERGYDAVTAGEIAERAGVSRRTFFRHFPTKDAVVFSNHETRIARFRRLLEKHRGDSTPFGAVRKALLAFAAEYESNKRELLNQYSIIRTSPFLIARELDFDSEYEAAIADAIAPRGRASVEMQQQARFFAGAVFGAIRAVLKEWFEKKCRPDIAKMGATVLDMLEVGAETLSHGDRILRGTRVAGSRDD